MLKVNTNKIQLNNNNDNINKNVNFKGYYYLATAPKYDSFVFSASNKDPENNSIVGRLSEKIEKVLRKILIDPNVQDPEEIKENLDMIA